MGNNNTKTLGEAPWLHVILSTGFFTGLWPWGPGTLGGAVGLLMWIGCYYALPPAGLAIATIVLAIGSLPLGVWTANVMERYWGEDPRAVVIDEYHGTWVAILATLFCTPDEHPIILATIAFVLFRIIDITKPLGCRWVDRNIHGGLGCMIDDTLAGSYALIITLVIRLTGIIDMIIN